jgi:hypothetical protein
MSLPGLKQLADQVGVGYFSRIERAELLGKILQAGIPEE